MPKLEKVWLRRGYIDVVQAVILAALAAVIFGTGFYFVSLSLGHHHGLSPEQLKQYALENLSAYCILNSTEYWLVLIRNTGDREVTLRLVDAEDPPRIRPRIRISGKALRDAISSFVKWISSLWKPKPKTATVAERPLTGSSSATTIQTYHIHYWPWIYMVYGPGTRLGEVRGEEYVLKPGEVAAYIVYCRGDIKCEQNKTLRLKLKIGDVEIWKECEPLYYLTTSS